VLTAGGSLLRGASSAPRRQGQGVQRDL